MLSVEIVPLLKDNYGYLLRDEASGLTAAVDPSEAGPILEALRRKGWLLNFVLNTHHHWDHVGGNPELKEKTGCRVLGPQRDVARIPACDGGLSEGSGFSLGESRAEVIFIPGHTSGHVALWFPQDRAVFTGDTLFSLGCGRLFEGTPAQMWSSLSRLGDLPDETRVYCGHEYTVNNAKFALGLEPDNEELKRKKSGAEALRAEGKPTLPSLLGEEKRWNPFLRVGDAGLREKLGLPDSPVEAFAELRRRKDVF